MGMGRIEDRGSRIEDRGSSIAVPAVWLSQSGIG